MSSTNLDTNQLVALIYDTAIDGEKWPDLLDALAHFIHQLPNIRPTLMLNDGDGDITLSRLTNNRANASLTHSLQQLCQSNSALKTNLVPVRSEQEEINQLLLGHFGKALNIARQVVVLQEKQQATLSILDQLPIALIIVDKTAAMMESNLRARQLLSETDLLNIQQGQLQAKDNIGAKKLREIITCLADSSVEINSPEAITLSGHHGNDDNLMLILSPSPASSFSDSNHVSIFISSNKIQPIVLPETIKQHFALSNTEFAIASQLVRGLSIKEIADKNGTKENTVRTQVKAIFAKTNTSRQAELIALLLGGSGSAIGYRLLSESSANRPGSDISNQHRRLTLNDGRHMAYQEYGDPNGEPVVFCHSILGSRLELPFNGATQAAARNIRLIIPDRPGRGQSSPHLDGNLLQWTDDLLALANHLELNTFNIIGYAMGGLFAYASAFSMPDRIKQVVLISSGTSPQSDEDFHAMQPLYSMMQKMARGFPRIHRLVVTLMSWSFLKNPQQLIERLAQNLCESDTEILQQQEFHELFFNNLTEVYCQGTNHYAHDVEISSHPEDWGFSPQNINQPIQMWHGQQDFGIPLILAEKFQQQAANVTLKVLPDKGHYLFYDHWPMILDQMLEAQD